MKRYIIPALFVIDANDEKEAESMASDMMFEANIFALETKHSNAVLYMDEKLQNRVIEVNPNEENPHSYDLLNT